MPTGAHMQNHPVKANKRVKRWVHNMVLLNSARRSAIVPRSESWWCSCAAPDQRAAFMAAARARHHKRLSVEAS